MPPTINSILEDEQERKAGKSYEEFSNFEISLLPRRHQKALRAQVYKKVDLPIALEGEERTTISHNLPGDDRPGVKEQIRS